MKSSSRSSGSPATGATIPVGPVGQRPRAETALSGSVISSTWALPPVTSRIRPTRPSPLITASFRSIPELEPLSIVDRREPDRRRAPDHPRGDRLEAAERRRRGRSRAASRTARSRRPPPAPRRPGRAARRPPRAAARSRPRASKVSSNQLTRSRAGFSARSAPSPIGESAPSRRRAGSCAAGRSRTPRSGSRAGSARARSAPTRTARRLRTCLRYIALGRAPPTRRRRWELRFIRWITSNSSSERPGADRDAGRAATRSAGRASGTPRASAAPCPAAARRRRPA